MSHIDLQPQNKLYYQLSHVPQENIKLSEANQQCPARYSKREKKMGRITLLWSKNIKAKGQNDMMQFSGVNFVFRFASFPSKMAMKTIQRGIFPIVTNMNRQLNVICLDNVWTFQSAHISTAKEII